MQRVINTLKDKQTGRYSHLRLEDIRPQENRYRSYEIKVEELASENGYGYSVKLVWGRIGQKKANRVHFAGDEKELRKILKPILRSRYRHGYRIVGRSKDFPAFDILSSFETTSPLPSLQLSLFPLAA